jgi:hypothetical protein
MLARDPSVGPGRVLHKYVQAGEPEAMPKFQEKVAIHILHANTADLERGALADETLPAA